MLRSLFSSATGMAAQQFNLDVIANNLANVSTVGFKRYRADFQDLVYQTIREAGGQSGPGTTVPTGSQVGLGVSQGTTIATFTQGVLQNTGGAYDMAIRGEGFFRVQLPDGTIGFTRAGNFTIDERGRLVTPEGMPLAPEIIIPQNREAVNIAPDGQVIVKLPGQPNAQTVGQIQLSMFVNPAGLRALGGNLFAPTQASGQPVDGTPGTQGLGGITHRSLEASNVDVVEEMVRMIVLQRAYETNSKAIQTADEMLSVTNSVKR
jgi:flagellar basal-body rod protein FlgG